MTFDAAAPREHPRPKRERGARLWRSVVVPLARDQHDVVARRQLLAHGVPPATVRAWVRLGLLHARWPGVYDVGRVRADPEARWTAATLVPDLPAGLSHGTAAEAMALEAPRGGPVHVTVAGRSARSRCGLVVHHAIDLDPRSIGDVDGVPCLRVPRVLVDLASEGDVRRAARAWKQAARLRLLHLPAVEAELRLGRKGSRIVRALLEEERGADEPPDVESVLEGLAHGVLADVAAEPPLSNVVVCGARHVHAVDLCFDAVGLVVELDGWETHGPRAQREEDLARDADLAAVGVRTIRLSWRLVTRAPLGARAAVQGALALGSGAPVRVLGPASSVMRSRKP